MSSGTTISLQFVPNRYLENTLSCFMYFPSLLNTRTALALAAVYDLDKWQLWMTKSEIFLGKEGNNVGHVCARCGKGEGV
jgi:hypothetical protein